MKNLNAPNCGWLWTLILLSACYQPEEGCLDIVATNYDVEATRPCELCCEYPQLNLRIQHRYDTSSFELGNRYVRGSDTTVFLNFRFYVSEIALSNTQQQLRYVQDSLLLQGVRFTDDFARISPNQNSVPLGQFSHGEATYASLQMQLGITEPIASITPDSFLSNHPLAWSPDSLFGRSSMQYIDLLVHVIPDVSKGDTVVVRAICQSPPVMDIPISTYVDRGYDVEADFLIDYAAWTKGIDFTHPNTAALAQQLCQQAPSAFLVAQ